MATSYTSSLRLVKQGDGENPNSWGTVLNDGMISLTDDAIAGYTTISIGSAATVTLSAVDGGQDQARKAFVEIIGSVGGTHDDIVILIPQKSKSYIINNKVSANTTASDTVKLKNDGAGTGYTVPFGSIGLVISNGTSVFGTNATGLGFGTAASADIGVCATNVPKVSAADLRYVRTSVTTDATVRGNITYEAGSLQIGTSARAYSPFVTVTDAACVSVNFALGNTFVVTLGGNRTLKAPANCTAGQSGTIHVIQDGTGSRTLAYNTAWQFVSGTVPTLSTGASDVDILCYIARSATTVDTVLLKNFDR